MLPYPFPEIFKVPVLLVDVNRNGLYDPGDTVRWVITIESGISISLQNLRILDELPPQLIYIANSTVINNAAGPPGSVFPFQTEYVLPSLSRGQQVSFVFLFGFLINSSFLPPST